MKRLLCIKTPKSNYFESSLMTSFGLKIVDYFYADYRVYLNFLAAIKFKQHVKVLIVNFAQNEDVISKTTKHKSLVQYFQFYREDRFYRLNL